MGENEIEVVETQDALKKDGLYTCQVEDFLKSAKENIDEALDRYGFTLWHSLPRKAQVDITEKLGLKALEARDHYNRGTALALEEKYDAAEAELRIALKKDADYAPAAFNLALCLEKLERFGDARKMYEKYLTLLDRARGRRDLRVGSDEEIEKETARIHQHLDTLGKA